MTNQGVSIHGQAKIAPPHANLAYRCASEALPNFQNGLDTAHQDEGTFVLVILSDQQTRLSVLSATVMGKAEKYKKERKKARLLSKKIDNQCAGGDDVDGEMVWLGCA